jgi:transposase
MAGFRNPEIPREQMVLWSERLEDAIALDHPVRQVEFLLRSEGFAAGFADWCDEYVLLEGKPPYHPRDLVGLYIYGMLNRIRSSRQLEQACYNRLDVIWLMSGQHPDHSTIHEFLSRPANAKRIHRVFREVLFAAKRAGLVKGVHVNVDGTKIEANAGRGSVHKESSIEAELAKVDAQIAALEQEYKENEAKETLLLGDKTPWVPERRGSLAQRQSQLIRQQEKLKQALAAIARRRAETVSEKMPKAIASVTDPDSRVMRDKEGRRKPNYNSQLATDTEKGVILATDVNDAAEDSGQATLMVSKVEENLGDLPPVVSADSQYNTGPELKKLDEMGVVAYMPDNGTRSDGQKVDAVQVAALAAAHAGEVLSDEQWNALPKEGKIYISKEAFSYDTGKDCYRCPMGSSLPFLRTSRKKQKGGIVIRSQYGGCPACAGCPRATMCCKTPSRGRIVNRDQYESYRERLRARMQSEDGRAIYKLRGQTVEPRFGLIKYGLGVRRFLRRGLAAVRTEWELIATTVNIGILLRHWAQVRVAL